MRLGCLRLSILALVLAAGRVAPAQSVAAPQGTAAQAGSLPSIEQFLKIRAPQGATLGGDGTLYVRDFPEGVVQLYKIVPTKDAKNGPGPNYSPAVAAMSKLTSYQDGIGGHSLSPDGKRLIIGTTSETRVWDTGSGECLAVYVATPNGAVVFRPRDGRYRSFGDPAGRVAYTIGLARYELGELDEFVEGGLRLSDDERLIPA